MKKNLNRVAGVFFASLLLSLLLAACDGGQQQPQAPSKGNIFIFRLSNPDEALNSLIQETNPEDWAAYQNTSADIPASADREVICYHIGVKSANALLSVFLEDYETAEGIAQSIKKAADQLNIRSDEIETIAKQLVEDLEEKDEQAKAVKVKQTLNMLKDEVISVLNDIGNEAEAVMIEYGAWIDALRQTSSIIADGYSEKAASALLRSGEAEYFKRNFASFNLHSPGERYKSMLDAASQLRELMIPDAGNSLSL